MLDLLIVKNYLIYNMQVLAILLNTSLALSNNNGIFLIMPLISIWIYNLGSLLLLQCCTTSSWIMDHDLSDLSEYNETIDPAPGIIVNTADYGQLSEQLPGVAEKS